MSNPNVSLSPQRQYSTQYGNKESILHMRDRRYKVHKPHEYPWTMFEHMTMTYKYPMYKDVYVGSGIMVNSHHVLTAGHNLYAHKNGGIPDEVSFYPGRNGVHIPWSLNPKNIIVHPDYCRDEHSDADIGMLVLEGENVGNVSSPHI